MNSKFTLALIALVGVGVFALPSTMALFAGQHSFYNIDATGNQVPCQKCHGDVKVELNGDTAKAGSKAPHADFKCEYCHRSEAGMASGDDAYAKITYSTSTGSRIYLVTTIANFENGNFPKGIQYTSGMTVDTWLGSVYALDGVTPWTNISAYDADGGLYAGSLSSSTTAGRYNYSYASETSTRSGGVPKDTNTSTQNTAFSPRAITWNGTTESLVGAGSNEVTPGTRYHAASLVSCMECHGGEQAKGAPGYEIETPEPYNHANWLIDATDPASTCANCHYSTASHTPQFETALEAGGFGLTGMGGESNDTGAVEAHNAFVKSDSQGILRSSTSQGSYGASNIACVACHTHVAVDINFQKKYKVKLDAYGMSTGNWSVGGYAAEGTVNTAEYGNSDGSVFGTSNQSYNWTPTQTLYVNGNQSQVISGLNNDANDSLGALTSP